MGVLEIFGGCPGDFYSVSWRYSMIVLDIFDGFLEIFDGCPEDI